MRAMLWATPPRSQGSSVPLRRVCRRERKVETSEGGAQSAEPGLGVSSSSAGPSSELETTQLETRLVESSRDEYTRVDTRRDQTRRVK
jgi:hypothetical protein